MRDGQPRLISGGERQRLRVAQSGMSREHSADSAGRQTTIPFAHSMVASWTTWTARVCIALSHLPEMRACDCLFPGAQMQLLPLQRRLDAGAAT